MKYTEYLKSAKRHDYTCEVLKGVLDNTNINDEDKKKYLFLNIYYISGYIFECSIKYKILEICNHDEAINVDKNSCLNFNFNFHDDFKIHKLERLFDVYDNLGGGRYIINDSVVDLFNNWKPDIRYEDISCSTDAIFEFYSESRHFLYVR